MSQKSPVDDFNGSGTYEIRVKGHLDDRWTETFEYMQLTRVDDGTTSITGTLPDQTALHSILQRIRNMNLTLISVTKKQGSKA